MWTQENDFIISNFLMTSRTLEDMILSGKKCERHTAWIFTTCCQEGLDRKGRKEITMELIFSILYQLAVMASHLWFWDISYYRVTQRVSVLSVCNCGLKKKFALLKLAHIQCQKYMIQWLTCNDAISGNCVVIKCQSLAYFRQSSIEVKSGHR